MAKARTAPKDDKLDGMFIATATFATEEGVVHKGQVVRTGDSRLKSGYFRPATEADLVEQATAGPGEHRNVTW
jgi:hypothetical protein